MILGGHFDLASKKEEIIALTKKTEDVNFWNNHEEAEHTLNELNSLKAQVNQINSIRMNDLNMLRDIFSLSVSLDN